MMTSKIKLQPGDYALLKDMTQEQWRAVCDAFIKAGAPTGESHKANYFKDEVTAYIGWHPQEGVFFGDDDDFSGRLLTLDQILSTEQEQTMDIKEAYRTMQANCGIEVGDTVRVLRKAADGEMGWGTFWNDIFMNHLIGEVTTVEEVTEYGPVLKGARGNSFPFFVLELIKKGTKLPKPLRISSQYQCEFKEDGSIKVGCQTLDFALVKKIYKTAKKVRAAQAGAAQADVEGEPS